MREFITFECKECGNRFYTSTVNKKLQQEKLELKKFCKYCRKHTAHKQTK